MSSNDTSNMVACIWCDYRPALPGRTRCEGCDDEWDEEQPDDRFLGDAPPAANLPRRVRRDRAIRRVKLALVCLRAANEFPEEAEMYLEMFGDSMDRARKIIDGDKEVH